MCSIYIVLMTCFKKNTTNNPTSKYAKPHNREAPVNMTVESQAKASRRTVW